jgi:hypothetical protein
MPIHSSSPKAVRRCMKALAAAGLTIVVTAAPAAAVAAGGYDLGGTSDAAQRTAVEPVVFGPGASDAAQRTAADPVVFGPGASDAAQRSSDAIAFSPGVSDAAQRAAANAAPARTSYQPAPSGYGAHMTPMTVSGVSELPTGTGDGYTTVADPEQVADDGFDWTSAVQGLLAGFLFLLISAAAVHSTRRISGHASRHA